ncbi:hypothetical protein E4U41_003021 [Claviceps citrina]|nr:hypothetical protein E4U41_003021 [Claviceps citrina]
MNEGGVASEKGAFIIIFYYSFLFDNNNREKPQIEATSDLSGLRSTPESRRHRNHGLRRVPKPKQLFLLISSLHPAIPSSTSARSPGHPESLSDPKFWDADRAYRSMGEHLPYFTIRSRRPADGHGSLHPDTPGLGGVTDGFPKAATHDVSRTSFHVKHIGAFARRLEDSVTRAFPNRGRSSQRYRKVQALLLHWGSDDLFVLPELEDLEKCLREEFAFGTDVFAIPSDNSHLELMMRVCQLIKQHESQDTLFLVYYGGHARIDESRQSTWCATRDQSSPWLQWSAIQTLLERSTSDVLILLDCCAGAASATFPSGNSITETISASSWDAIAPDPGRYSFTNALIEVLQEWRMRTFSAAMLHAEVLARLKHPRPVTINGKHFEARSTPVHFMMTANHKAPSIELSRVLPLEKVAGPVLESESALPHHTVPPSTGRAADSGDPIPDPDGLAWSNEPNEDTPHVMISLALEDDQQLDIREWEGWLSAFPSMAKYVKVQGVFRSHSTLMLVSLPVMVWDLLPEDPAVSFVAFIRSNNLAMQTRPMPQRVTVPVSSRPQQMELDNVDNESVATGLSETTFAATEDLPFQQQHVTPSSSYGIPSRANATYASSARVMCSSQAPTPARPASPSASWTERSPRPAQTLGSSASLNTLQRQGTPPVPGSSANVSGEMMLNQQQAMRRTTLGGSATEPKRFSAHIERRLEEYYQADPFAHHAHGAFIASNLGIELWHLNLWFDRRRDGDFINNRLATLMLEDTAPEASGSHEPRMILPAELDSLLELSPPGTSVVFDLRSASEYERSHVYGAINLRAPKSFLQAAPLDLIERAIPGDRGRKYLSQWTTAKCLVFYGRGLESSWECPAAELMAQKLRARGWTGHCFVLRGHYKEFSQSFIKHVFASKTAEAAQDWSSSRVTMASHVQFASWLDVIMEARPMSTPRTQTPERQEAFETQEKMLEAEFKARCGPLFRKAVDIQMSSQRHDNLDTMAEMAGYLDRGLDKLRGSSQIPPFLYAPEPMEPTSGDMSDVHMGKTLREQDVEDEYVEISRSKSRLFLSCNEAEKRRPHPKWPAGSDGGGGG